MVESLVTTAQNDFSSVERAAVYRALRERRDVRAGYLPQPVDDTTLYRLLSAAHQAPSVGFMQPWRFIVVRNEALRAAVHGIFERANNDATARYGGDQKELYSRLKLEGLREAPQHLCVLCDEESKRGTILAAIPCPKHPPIR